MVAYSDNQDAALEYIKWFAQPASVQAKWWELGGYSCHVSVLNGSGLRLTAQPFASRLPDSRWMIVCRISGRSRPTPSCLLAMQKRLHDYVVADQGTAKEALDKLIEDWTEVFEDEGKL